MTLKQTIEAFEALDSARASGRTVVDLLAPYPAASVSVEEVRGNKGKTDFVKIIVAGMQGRLCGGAARTLGIIGRLGGIGARPGRIGLVSDGDGAVAAIAAALKIARMHAQGDPLPGDVIVATHICPDAPTRPHVPVEFMDSPVSVEEMNAREVAPEMDAVLAIDTTKGNRILNHRGFAISPTVKEGWILRVADDLVRIMETTTGRSAVTFPITMQDITPYGNGIHHLNSILQPAVATDAPVVGVAISAQTVVAGSATGASHEIDIAAAAKFAVAGKTNGELAMFCWAITSSEEVSSSMLPERKREPSGETASTAEAPERFRLPRTLAEATSKLKTYREVACSCTPMMVFPSEEACRRARLACAILEAERTGAAGAGGAIATRVQVPATGSTVTRTS